MASRGGVSACGQSAKIPAPLGTSPDDHNAPFSGIGADGCFCRNLPLFQHIDDALRMIFSEAEPRDLSALVVVSSDPLAGKRYRSGLSMLKHLMSRGWDEE